LRDGCGGGGFGVAARGLAAGEGEAGGESRQSNKTNTG
jgi:hypothetical protein